MIKKPALILIGSLLTVASYGQSDVDLSRINELDSLASPLNMIEYLKPQADRSEKDSDSLQTVVYYFLGKAYGEKYENDTATYFLEKALRLAEANGYTYLQATTYNSLGNVSRSLSANDQAMAYYSKGLSLIDTMNNRQGQLLKSKITGNIGGIYYDLGQYDKALEYASASFEVIKKYDLKDRYFLAYLMMAFSHRALGNLEEALSFNERVLGELMKTGDSSYLPHTYYNIASIYTQKELWGSASDYFRLAETVATAIQEWEVYVSCLISRAEMAQTRGRMEEGLAYAERARDASVRYGLLPKHVESLGLYSQLLQYQGNLALAIITMEQREVLKDSLFKQESMTRIERLESQYQKRQDQQRIRELEMEQRLAEEELSRRRYLLYLLVVSIFSVGVISLLVFRQFRIKSESRYRLLEFQLNEFQSKVAKLLGKSGGQIEMALKELNASLVHPVSDKEYEVLLRILEDKTNQQISEELSISVNTVKFHLKNIYEKLEVANRREVVEKIFRTTV